MQTNDYVLHTTVFPTSISGPEVRLSTWMYEVEEESPQVYRRSGVLSRGSTLNILADRRGNCIHIRSISQLKKDVHDKPRVNFSTVLGVNTCPRLPQNEDRRLGSIYI